jgi:sugar lactone lactonase YvrE
MRNQLARFAAVVLAGAVVSFTSASAGASSAPKVTFVGVQLTLNTGTTFTTPQGVAVDSSGDVFVLDSQTGIVSEIVALNGIIGSSPTIQPLANSFAFNNVFSLAIDSSGNLFVPGGSTPGAEYIYEIPAAHRTVNPTQLTLAGTFDTPEGITVDASGNIFVVEDGSANDVKEIAPPYHTATTAIIGLSSPTGIAVDASDNIFVAVGSGGGVTEFSPSNSYATGTVLLVEFEAVSNMSMDTSGNLYVADEQGGTLSEILASGGYGTEITLSKNFNAPTGVAVATNGNIFVTDVPDGGIVDEFERPGANLGAVNLGQTSSTKTLTFVFNTAGHIGAPVVLTQGAAGLDYVDAGTGTCTIKNGSSNPYNAGATCTVDVSFTPRYPGARNGAVELKDLSGNVLATAYLYGTGIGPQVSFVTTASGYNAPSAVSTLGGGFNYPYGVATDQSGNVFVVDQGNVAIKKISAGCGTSTCVTTLAGTYTDPSYVAIDGAGNLYVTDANQVVEISAASGYTTTTNTLGGGPYQPTGVAVDGSGNVYVNDISMVTGERQVQKIPAGCTSSACVTTLAGGYTSLYGLAVDASGDVFFAELYAGLVHEIPAGCASIGCVVTVGTGLTNPAGLAVDGIGNLFVSDYGAGNVYELTAASGYNVNYRLNPQNAFAGPMGVAVDGLGNVIVVNTSANSLQKLDFADPPSLSFLAPTTIETIDGTDGPLSVTVENVGNAPLIFTASGLIAANDFPQTAGSGDPPNCADSRTVAAGASCNLSIEFEPLQTGSLGETFGLYDNNLNVASAQLIGVQGISIPAVAPPPAGDATSSTVLAAPSAVAAGQPLTITATVTDTTSSDRGPGGTVTFADTVGSTTINLNSGVGVSLVASAGAMVAILPNVTLSGAGTHTITATFWDGNGGATFQSSIGTGTATVGSSSNVGTATSAIPVTLTFTAAGMVNSVNVLTQGAPLLDFQYSATGDTCSGASSSVGTCTVNVTFTPKYPGTRFGAVVLEDVSGNVLATAYINGLGIGPVVGFAPGTINTVAGNYLAGYGYGGDGSPATSAQLNGPYGVAQDGAGNLYIADSNNNVIRMVTTGGIISTIVGNDSAKKRGSSYGGDGGPATSAMLYNPQGIALDGAGNLFIADTNNQVIRMVTPGGIITTVAGNNKDGYGYSGDGGLAINAELNNPNSIALDGAGNLYIVDTSNNVIRKVTPGGVISTVAGNHASPPGYGGDGGQATSAQLSYPSGVAVDGSGNLYIADQNNNVIRKVTPGGVISTVAGNQASGSGYGPDGVQATSSQLSYPMDVKLDAAGNLYIVDDGNSVIRKVTPGGIISTVAGGGNYSSPALGDGGPATSAFLNYPEAIAVDGTGNLYISDSNDSLIRKVDISDAPSVTFASTNVGSTSAAQNVAVENFGNTGLIFTSSGLTPANDFVQTAGSGSPVDCVNSGTVLAGASCNLSIVFHPAQEGNPLTESFVLANNSLDNGSATQSIGLLGTATGVVAPPADTTATAVAVSSGAIYSGQTVTIAATVWDTISRLTPTGTVIFTDTVGSTTTNLGGATPLTAGVATISNNILTGAGTHTITASYAGVSGSFTPSSNTASVTVTDAPVATFTTPPPTLNFGTVAVGQTSSNQTVTFTFATMGVIGPNQVLSLGATDGKSLPFYVFSGGTCNHFGVATVWTAGGTCTVLVNFKPVYPGVAQGAVEILDMSGNVLSTAYVTGIGTGPEAVTLPGTARSTTFTGSDQKTYAMAFDGGGDLYFADQTGNQVYQVQYSGAAETLIAGSGTAGYGGDGSAAASAELSSPSDVAIDGAGNVYIADFGNNRVRMVSPISGIITTVAGNGTLGYLGDGSAATSAELNGPTGLALDGAGNLYIADKGNNAIRKVTAATGVITTVAGNGTQGFSGDAGLATVAQLNNPNSVAVDGAGNLYIADSNNNRVRMVSVTTGNISTVAGNGTNWDSGDGGFPWQAGVNNPVAVAVDAAGNLAIVDSNAAIRIVFSASGIIETDAVNVGVPVALREDGAGNLYAADSVNGGLYTVSPTTSFNYPTATAVGSSDTTDNAQTVLLVNIGNTALTAVAPGLTPPTDFAQVGGSGTPADCTPTFSITAGSACTLNIEFEPTQSGSLSEYYYVKDNSRNHSSLTQYIWLTGTGVAAVVSADTTATAIAVSPSAIYSGQTVTITATVTDTTTPSTTPTGSVTFTDAVGSTITSLNGGTAVSLVSGVATLSNATLIGAGTHTISAQYSGVSSVFSASSGTGTVAVSPSSNVGAAASSFPVTLTITAAGTESSVSVLTLGVPNLDFTEALTGDTCSGVSSINSTCTVNVTFTPISPGLRSGAVVLKDSSGNVLATSSISAMADAPQVAIYPGTSSVLSTGTSTVAAKYPGQIAIDGSGNIYLANCSNGLVYKIPASGGEPTTIDFSALSGLGPNNCVNGIVLDGAGNMYVSDHSNERIVVVNGATGSSPSAAFALPLSSTSLGSVSLYDPYTLAMDVQGNLYIADSANVRILKVVLTGAGTSSVTGAVSAVTPVSYSYNNGSYDQIYGVAVDDSGNVYIPDYDGGVLVKVAPGGATTTINLTYNSNTFYPTGIGLDSFGNVYLVDGYDNWLAKLTTSGTLQPILAPGLPSGLSEPWNITVDPAGKLYISDFGNNRIAIIDPSTPYVAPFASAAVGSNSTSGPQLLQLTNIGDQDLTFTASGVSYPTDFPVNSSDTNLCQSSLNLTAGNTCDVSINFHPTTTGSLPENVVLTDNNLAGNGVQQSISVSGTGQAVIAQFAFSISSIWTAGVPQAFTLTAIGSDSATMTGYTGTVNLTSTDSRAVFSLSNGGAPITSYTFAGGDAGVKTLYVTFKTETFSTKLPYGQFVTATDASASISAMTGSLTVNSGPAATITPVGSTSSSHTIGVEFPLYAVVNDAYGNPVVGEIVTFSAPVNGPGILMAQATEPVQTLGYAENLVFANTIAGGPYAVTAIAADLPSSPLTFAITNLPAATTTVLAGAPASPINYGTAITLTSTVTPGSGQVEKKSLIAQPQKIVIVSSSAPILGPPTGTVQFWDNIGTAAQAMVGTATLQPGVNSNGTIPASATFTVVAPAGGTHSYTATYLTDGNYSGSTTSVAVPYTVNQGSVAISGPAQPAQFAAGQAGSVTITATGSVLGTGIAVPSGSLSYTIVNGSSVSVASGTVSLSATANGSAASIITPNTLAPGTYSIQIGYVGDGNYAASVSPVTITFIVNQIASSISWPQPSAISYGTSLGAILNATASAGSTALQGAFSYTATPTSGAASAVNSATVLTAGSYTLTATFAPTNSATDTSATQTVSLTVSKAALAITWTAPASISYGVPLSATQLNASATVPGTFVYSPAIGTVLGAGPQTLSVTFTPTDSVDYSSTTQTVSLTVNKTTLAITWITPASISYGVPLSATQLNATATVPGTFVYSPAIGSVLGAGPQTLSVTFTPTDSVDYSTTTQTVSLTVNKAALAITWAAPASVSYGVPLSATQLNATATVPGTFVYSPAVGSVLGAGPQTLSVTFTPTDSVDYSTTTQTTSLTVNKASLTITWAAPNAITYGVPLSAAQLNATASVPGTFVYSPALGSVLGAGSQTLSVTFTPTDSVDYSATTQTTSLTVNKDAASITWSGTSTPITYGTPLSATQLNATTVIPGTLVYAPPLGTVLGAGTQSLSVTFTPTDSVDYSATTQTTSLTVNKDAASITWSGTSTPITYGTPLSATQLNATTVIPGTLVYAPPLGTVLGAGTQSLSVTFTPTDTASYASVTKTETLTVNKAMPVITWLVPAAITPETALSATQLDATASVPGMFVYTPSLGTMLSIGTQTLSVIFTANDTTDYTTATQSVSLNIGQITPTITFLQPSAITYGNSLSGVLMVTAKNGSATIPGTFTYTAARAGGSALPVTSATVLAAGTYTLTAIFTPTDTTTYKVASASVSLTANQAVSVTTLSSSQVSAFTSNPVTFTAIVTSAAGTPTGSVTFFDGTTPLGTATLVSGSAAYTSSSLDTGTHSITAVYNGNADLAPSTSGLVSEVLQNFTLTLSLRGGSGSGGTATAAPGGQAVYDFVVAPVTGTGFPGPVTMSVTGGLPPGATATFTPDVIPANATSTPVTMTVTLPATAAARPMGLPFRSAPLAALGLLLLPFAGRLRKASRKLGRGAGLALALLISIVGIAAMTGCGGKPSGYFGQAPQSYTITVTATSGNLTHSTTVTLNVQ